MKFKDFAIFIIFVLIVSSILGNKYGVKKDYTVLKMSETEIQKIDKYINNRLEEGGVHKLDNLVDYDKNGKDEAYIIFKNKPNMYYSNIEFSTKSGNFYVIYNERESNEILFDYGRFNTKFVDSIVLRVNFNTKYNEIKLLKSEY